MPRTRPFVASLFVTSLLAAGPSAAGELEQMKAQLGELQKLLLQQQARIEQLEKQAAPGMPAAATPAIPPRAAAASTTPPTTASAPVAAPDSATPPAATPPELALATLYGRLDLFAEANWGGSTGRRLAIESGGMNGSRVGIKGGKALNPETNFIYRLETGFFANNGRLGQTDSANTRIFGRQLYAGVEGRFGKLTVGRQYSPFFTEMMLYDAFDNGYGSPTNDGNVKPGPVRYDSALIYSSPRTLDLTATAFAALGGKTGGSERNTLGFSVDYLRGPLSLGLAYQDDDHNAVADKKSRHAFAGAGYQIDRIKLMGGIAGVDTAPDAGAKSQWRSWFIGSRIDVTASGQLRLNYGEGHTLDAALSDRGRVFSAAWMETLNEQFRAYLAWSRHLNDPGVAFAPSGTSANGYYTVNPGDQANGLAAGLQYVF